jgi:alpha-mannosidase
VTPIETIYLIHHSHTDIGYTHDQPVVWDLHTRFIDEALLLAEQYADSDSDGAFRWTVETTAPLVRWLEQATPQEIERFAAMEKAGRIEVTAMLLNITPLYDTAQVVETLQNVGRLRQEYGFDIRYAMNCDVNGENWPVVDAFLDAGIEGFTMAINNHFGGPPRPRPCPFHWQGPSGRTLLTYNGWTYDKGWTFGIGREDPGHLEEWWPMVQAYLDQIDYPLPILMLQSYDPFGDNGSALDFTPFIDAWNAAGKTPRIVMATPRIWWQAVEQHADQLETWRGDWTDYWNFGSISSAREQTLNRQSRTRLRSADALHAAVHTLAQETPTEAVTRPQWAQEAYANYREAAWEALHLWDEHTWGADTSVRRPEGEDTWSQWYHKAHYAYTARSLSLLLQRDGLAELARYVEREDEGDLLLFNPLPWPRTLAGAIPASAVRARGRAEDGTAARHHLDRRHSLGRRVEDLDNVANPGDRYLLRPTQVPGYGYTVVKRADLLAETIPMDSRATGGGYQASYDQRSASLIQRSEAATIENECFRVTFDREQGGVISLFDKELDWEWVDPHSGYALHSFVHEEVADREAVWPRNLLFERSWGEKRPELGEGWKPGWRAKRRRAGELLSHHVRHTPLGDVVTQTLSAPGIEGVLTQRLFLPNYAAWIECESWWDMGLSSHPDATYLLFPFHLPGSVARFDVGGQPVIPHEDQLPGACRDYFTVQGWVDFSDSRRGVTIALPENPMVQLGDFHFGDFQKQCNPERSMLLGWVTNNYWETNFRGHQPGRVSARYRIYPHAGGFDETQAHRWGLEALNDEPILQHLGEPRIAEPSLPAEGALLRLPHPPILTPQIKPNSTGNGVLVRLHNASSDERTAQIGSGLLKITGAQMCDLFGEATGELTVNGGSISIVVPARRVVTVCLQTAL